MRTVLPDFSRDITAFGSEMVRVLNAGAHSSRFGPCVVGGVGILTKIANSGVFDGRRDDEAVRTHGNAPVYGGAGS